MSQIDFFLCEAEKIQFIQYCFKLNCSVIPDQNYFTNKYIVVTDMKGYKKNCEESPLIFITNKDFLTYPLELDFFTKEEKKIYFIQQRHGGPTIDFYSPLGELEDKIVGPGFIGIYDSYYRNNQKFVPNKKLIEFYKVFNSYIKKNCKMVKLAKRTYWVGNLTVEKARKGEIKILPISGIDILEMIIMEK